jgi:hypothetical protein
MTTERDIPEHWSPTGASEPDDMTSQSRRRYGGDAPMSNVPTGSNSKSAPRSQTRNSQQPRKGSGKLPSWAKSWVLWSFLLALIPGTIGVMAMGILFKLPSAPNCPSIFWPLASASVRLHCAQLAASKDTVDDLLQAMDLVRQLPDSHPMRPEIDRSLEQWSKNILQIADERFQSGKLDDAIKIARRIPDNVSAYKLVEQQVNQWQSTWAKAETIYQSSEAQMREQKWHDAFMGSSRLLRIGNRYWATTKYEQLNRLIAMAREDGDKLAKAKGLAKEGTVKNILEAIKIAEAIKPESYIHKKAQEAIPEFGRKMLALAQSKLNLRNADEALDIAREIPDSAKLQLEKEDFIALAEAQQSAWLGTVTGLETAISQAQQIDPSRPNYQKAQQLAANWQVEIQDVQRLEKARSLAIGGTIGDLTAAIGEAQQIPINNPRGKEARQEIGRWVAQVQTIEDRPFLDRAEQLALLEDTNSLQAAIVEASNIRRGRALYPEARNKIATWTGKIQRFQDQPYLDRARELAASGNVNDAIATAQQIPTGRSLSGEAQSAINQWQGEIRAKDNWRQAREVALRGTPEALAEAIRIANRIPSANILRTDVGPAMDQWSQQILDIARSQSESDISRAIETARLIPKGTSAYSGAREQLRTWRQYLNPQPEATNESIPNGNGRNNRQQ